MQERWRWRWPGQLTTQRQSKRRPDLLSTPSRPATPIGQPHETLGGQAKLTGKVKLAFDLWQGRGKNASVDKFLGYLGLGIIGNRADSCPANWTHVSIFLVAPTHGLFGQFDFSPLGFAAFTLSGPAATGLPINAAESRHQVNTWRNIISIACLRFAP